MITVKTWRDQNGIYDVEVSGHALHSEYGHDIVCAGVSALTIATLNALLVIAKIEVDHTIRDGYARFTIKKENINDIVRALLDSFELGITAMLEDYGQFIQLLKREV